MAKRATREDAPSPPDTPPAPDDAMPPAKYWLGGRFPIPIVILLGATAALLRLTHDPFNPRTLLADTLWAGIIGLLFWRWGRSRRGAELQAADERARQRSETRFRAVFMNTAIGVGIVDMEGRPQASNPRMQEILGYSDEELRGMTFADFTHPDDAMADLELYRELKEGKRTHYQLEKRFIRKDGKVVWGNLTSSLLHDGDGSPQHSIGVVEDITERKRAEEEIHELTRYNRSLIEGNMDALMMVTPAGKITDVNRAMETITGLRREELIGSDAFNYFLDRQKALEGLNTVLIEGPVWEYPLEIKRNDGSVIPVLYKASVYRDTSGQIAGVLASARDITERKALEEQLVYQAFHDALTGLPNRLLFEDRLGHALNRAARHKERIAVLFVDLDGFKRVNDSLGHECGNKLLRLVAQRLLTCVRAEDTVARLGGDEFSVCLEAVTDVRYAARIAARILGALQAPFLLAGREVMMSASIGIAITDLQEAASAAGLLHDADLAMYRAKQTGKAQYVVYDEGMKHRTLHRLDMEAELRRAVECEEPELYYQPIVELINHDLIHHDLSAGRLVGMEALVRWRHPQRGIILPGEFVPLAEETGLILEIGRWVLREACRQVREWTMQFPQDHPPMVSINLSAKQFGHPRLVQDLTEALSKTGADARSVALEITESVVMDDATATIATLKALKELGLRLAIDDFGTGYSSLSYLKRFPVDMLKIDKSFVAGVGRDPEDTAITQAVITLGKTLDLQVVAEGAETGEQISHLQALGCELGQGYAYAKPMSKVAASILVSNGWCDLVAS